MSWCGEKLDGVWNPQYIQDFIRYAERDKQRIDEWITKAKTKLDEIAKMKFMPVVKLERRYYEKVCYFVSVEMRNKDNPAIKYFPDGHNKRFAGKERKLAEECAKSLAKELGAEIEKSF